MKKSIKKVLLVLPQEFKPKDRPAILHLNPPLGIGYIAASLENSDYEVHVIDAVVEGYNHVESFEQSAEIDSRLVRIGISFEELRERIEEIRPDVVGISSMFTMQKRNAHAVAAVVKSIDPSVPVIMGGAHPTAVPEMVLGDENVDFVVLAEGDNSIVPLLKAIEDGGDFESLDGIAYLGREGMVTKEKTQTIMDLDALPFPARHLLPMEKYLSAGVHHGTFGLRAGARPASLITSRGCQYRCNFCTAFKVFTRLPRLRSADNVIAEIDELVNRYGVNWLFFEDDQLVAKVSHTNELFDKMVERNYGLSWDTPNGVSAWLLNDKLLAKMKRAGCVQVNLAIESGNQYVLDKIINKPVKLDNVPALANTIRKLGMELGTFLVVGNISNNGVETLDQVRDSFRFARRLKVTPHVSYLTPYPGSEVLEIAEKKGYLIDGFNWDNLVISEQNITTPEWTPEELRRVTEAEINKTSLWFRFANPKGWYVRFLPRLIQRFKTDPLGSLVAYSRRIVEIQGSILQLPWHVFREKHRQKSDRVSA